LALVGTSTDSSHSRVSWGDGPAQISEAKQLPRAYEATDGGLGNSLDSSVNPWSTTCNSFFTALRHRYLTNPSLRWRHFVSVRSRLGNRPEILDKIRKSRRRADLIDGLVSRRELSRSSHCTSMPIPGISNRPSMFNAIVQRR
jgi:hypothetical protein